MSAFFSTHGISFFGKAFLKISCPIDVQRQKFKKKKKIGALIGGKECENQVTRAPIYRGET